MTRYNVFFAMAVLVWMSPLTISAVLDGNRAELRP
jgi:hypothetical protein